MIKHYFSTLAAILSAVVIVLSIRSCGEYLDRRAQLEREARAHASPTPWMPTITPRPAFVRVTMDVDVYGRDQKSAHLKAGTRVRVVYADGPLLLIEHEGERYTLQAALTTKAE